MGKNPSPLLIAVDGPAASGKGTLAQRLAHHFGLPHLDTGLLYRAVGYRCLQEGIIREGRLIDASHGIRIAQTLDIETQDGRKLQDETIGQAASLVSAIPQVRAALLNYQRHFAAQPGGAVLDGRDIGTVICPHATFKFYITATAAIRAERRYLQQKEMNPSVQYQEILDAIEARDQRDSTREAAPLMIAADAITLDSSTLTAEEVWMRALSLITSQQSH